MHARVTDIPVLTVQTHAWQRRHELETSEPAGARFGLAVLEDRAPDAATCVLRVDEESADFRGIYARIELAGISALASLVTLLPISVLGAGTRDLALIVLLAPYGIGRVEALALSTLFLALALANAFMCLPTLFVRAARLDRSG